MKQKSTVWTIGILVCLSLTATRFRREGAGSAAPRALSQTIARGTSGRSTLRAAEAYGCLPMAFEENRGQTDARVKFLSRGRGYTVLLTPGEAMVKLRRSERKATVKPEASGSGTAAALRIMLPGANANPHMAGIDRLPGKSNYFIGNDPAQWRRNISNYAQVRYQDVYPGIDLLYHGNQGQLEYDFEVAPGADPKDIRVAFPGAERIRLDPDGDLLLDVQGVELRLHKPVIYQGGESTARQSNGKQTIEGGYVLRASKAESKNLKEVGFEIARYDPTKPLVIDPVLSYSSYLGGSLPDDGYGIAVDNVGNVYVTGFTDSTDFPTAHARQPATGGGTDAFVAKLDPTGSILLYSTYLGGSNFDQGQGIAVDSAGNAHVTGYTFSTNFPTANALQAVFGGIADAFVAELDPTGSTLLYSTYLGGSGGEVGYGIAVDSAGNAYVTGSTASTNFPTATPLQPAYGGGNADAFVAELDPSGATLLYSTYLGGSDTDVGLAIAVDSAGSAYITGYTQSTDFPGSNPLQAAYGGGNADAFVAELDPSGATLLYSTYLGGSGLDRGYGIAVDSSGDAYVTGDTASTNFPTANPLQPANGGGSSDAFVAELDPTGSTLLYSTYLGGSGGDGGHGIAVDSAGNAYVTGLTQSTDFPTANPLQPANGGGGDAFVAELDPTGSTLLYSTYLGGSELDYGNSIAVDSSGNTYVTGYTVSSNFPTANPRQPANAGDSDAFVAKLTPNSSAPRHR